MITSSNGNIFRVSGHLYGEFNVHWWIPRTKASDAELWCFSLICAWINGWIINGDAGDLRRHQTHYIVTVMIFVMQNVLLCDFQRPLGICASTCYSICFYYTECTSRDAVRIAAPWCIISVCCTISRMSWQHKDAVYKFTSNNYVINGLHAAV